ncbi:MAG: hypothetical protein RR182_00285 [Alistipes sp.]
MWGLSAGVATMRHDGELPTGDPISMDAAGAADLIHADASAAVLNMYFNNAQ